MLTNGHHKRVTMLTNCVVFKILVMLLCFIMAHSSSDLQAIENIFSKCKKQTPEFDACMKRGLNNLRPYFKRGIPEIGVAPFDPHSAKEVEETRTILGIGYTLVLRDVFEYGWTQSTVTKFKTDWANARIIYSQYFPQKFLEGRYVFKSDVSGERSRAGRWNLTLRDYSQITRVARAGAGLEVRVEIDRIGDMELHITNLLTGRTALENLLDGAINALWKPGFILVRPAINNLVSSAFTNIWSESFKHFRIHDFIKN